MTRICRSLLAAFAVIPSLLAESSGDFQAFTAKLRESFAGQQSEPGYVANAMRQFDTLGSALDRGQYEKAQQLLQSMGDYGVPPGLQAEWLVLADELAMEIVERQQQAAIDWKAAVDDVASRVRTVCSAAETSADLDDVMVEIAALQMKRVPSNNLLAQRAQQKLEGTARFVDQWAKFLDYREAGDANQANQVLRGLSQGGGYPVLPAAEIQKFVASESHAPTSWSDAVRIAFRDVKTPSDIPAAVTRAEAMFAAPAMAGQQAMDFTAILAMQDAARNLESGDVAGARTKLLSHDTSSVIINVPALKSLHTALLGRLAAAEVADITGRPPESDTDSADPLLAETLDRLHAEKKFAEMAKIIARVGEIRRGINFQNVPWSPSDALALSAYASGAQLETAGDALAAINEYRRVITAGQTGKYAPTKEAEEALARLKKSNPAAFEEVDGVVLEELRQIRQELQRAMMTMQRRPPY